MTAEVPMFIEVIPVFEIIFYSILIGIFVILFGKRSDKK